MRERAHQFEFHRARKIWVRTVNEFKENEYFEFELKFSDKFAKLRPDYFEYFKFYQVDVQTIELEFHRVWNLSSKTRQIFEFTVAHSSTKS